MSHIGNGGSTWADLGVAATIPLFSATSTRRTPFTLTHRSTGTVTGDIQVRASVLDVDQANDTTFAGGQITFFVHPQ